MDFEFSEEQKLLKATVQRLVKREVEPLLASYPCDKPLPKEALLRILQLVQPLGMLGATIPMEDGGTDLGHVGLGIFAETLPTASFKPARTAVMIAHSGDEEQKHRFLPPLLAGKKIGANATSEPNAGSDPTAIEAKAALVNGKYVINGTKLWVSNASVSDILMVVASLGRDQAGRNMLCPFIVEREVSPYHVRDIEMIGLNQTGHGEVVLEDCCVPKENMLARAAGHAFRMLAPAWIGYRPVIGLQAVNCTQKALELSIKYAQERKQFGKVIGRFQLVQAMIAEMATLAEASRLLCYQSLSLTDKGIVAAKEASMAKYFASDASVKVTSMAIEIHGAYGLSRDAQLERLFRDARMLTIADGAENIQQLIIGRELLGIRAFT